jgi:hypothetical protein
MAEQQSWVFIPCSCGKVEKVLNDGLRQMWYDHVAEPVEIIMTEETVQRLEFEIFEPIRRLTRANVALLSDMPSMTKELMEEKRELARDVSPSRITGYTNPYTGRSIPVRVDGTCPKDTVVIVRRGRYGAPVGEYDLLFKVVNPILDAGLTTPCSGSDSTRQSRKEASERLFPRGFPSDYGLGEEGYGDS